MSGPRRYDLIVLGAGPAGSASAFVAARAGLRVALVDQRAFPRDKLCGGGLTGRAMQHLATIFGPDAPDCPMTRRTAVQFGAFGQDVGRLDPIPGITLVMRRSFDLALLQAALAAGAEDFTGCRIDHIDPDRPAVTLGGATLHAPLLIGADGVNSPTARALFGRAFDRRTIGFALEVERPGDAGDTDLRIDFGAAEWGYGWQFPKPCGTTIGVGGVSRRNADIKAALARYRARLGADESLPVKGHFLPFGDARRVPGRGAVLLAGDAAGLVDPITGEGIAYALQSGAMAARAAQAALGQGAPAKALSRYRRDLRPVHAAIAQARLIRPLLFAPSLRRPFIGAFRRSRTLKHEYFRLVAGEIEYPQITRSLILRLPRYAARILTENRALGPGPAPPAP